MGNPQRDLCPRREWASGVHVASKQAQVRGACREKPTGSHKMQYRTKNAESSSGFRKTLRLRIVSTLEEFFEQVSILLDLFLA